MFLIFLNFDKSNFLNIKANQLIYESNSIEFLHSHIIEPYSIHSLVNRAWYCEAVWAWVSSGTCSCSVPAQSCSRWLASSLVRCTWCWKQDLCRMGNIILLVSIKYMISIYCLYLRIKINSHQNDCLAVSAGTLPFSHLGAEASLEYLQNVNNKLSFTNKLNL